MQIRSFHLRTLATAAAIVVGLLGATTPANAEIRQFTDPAGDSGNSVDFTRATVTYNKVLRVSAAYPQSELELNTLLNVWLDTKRSDPGPEYKVSALADSDFLGIFPVERFGGPTGEAVNCPSFAARVSTFTTLPRVWVKMKATCVDAPDKVRVAIQARHGGDSEWIKAPQTFLPPVERF